MLILSLLVNKVCFTELKPYMLKIIMWYTYFANKINTNFGNPFFLLVANIHKILTERLKRKVDLSFYNGK